MYTLTYEIQTQTTVIYHYREQSLEGSFFSAIWSNISKTSASVSSGFQTQEWDQWSMKPRGRRPSAFIVFECLKSRWNTKPEFLKLLLQQKKFSLNYHLNNFSQFNYYIWDLKYAWTLKNVYDVHGPIT